MPFLSWLEEAAGDDRPFFAHFGFGGVHTGGGYVAASRQLERIDPDSVTLPPWEQITHPVLKFQATTKNRNHRPSDEEILASRRHYYADIAEIDDGVGLILEKLEQLHLDDSTWVFVVSDHGDMQMEHGGQYAKMNFYEASSRVLCLARGPGGATAQRVETPVSLIDLCPTICELAGVDEQVDFDGCSLAETLHGDAGSLPGMVAGQFHGCWAQTSMFMLRQGPWKLVEYPGFPSQLFNLVDDPDEVNDLADSSPDILGELGRSLRDKLDVEAITRVARDRNHADFVRWNASVSREEYKRTIEDTFGRFAPVQERHWQQLEQWARGKTPQGATLD